ncbi:MAG: hypothetical protein ACRDNL_06950, partial [Spirillospora sp.]
GAPGAPEPHDVIDVIAALIDKSLVMADGDPEVRYRLLETVGVYAGERLTEAGEAVRIRSAHAAYLVELAERAEPELRRHDQLQWAERLAEERGNVTVAFRHLIETGDRELSLRLVAGLVWFWVLRDLEIEAGHWAVAVRDMVGDTAPPGLEEPYALCVVSAGLISEMSKDTGPTPETLAAIFDSIGEIVPERPMHPALALMGPASYMFSGDMDEINRQLRGTQDHPDPWVRAAGHALLAHMGINTGHIDEAADEAAEGYARFRDLGDRFGMILGLSGMMQVATARGDLADAIRFGEEAYGYATAGVSPEQGAAILTGLARARIQQGDVARAREDLELALAQMDRIGEFAEAAGASLMLCELDLREGDREAARPHAERAYKWIEPRESRPDFAQAVRRTYSRLGGLAEEDGDLDVSVGWHLRAFSDLTNDALMGNPTLASLVDGIAALAAARGAPERAAELLGTAHHLRGFRDISCYDVQRTIDAAVRALGDAAFSAAYDRGRRVTRDDVFAAGADIVHSTSPPAT